MDDVGLSSLKFWAKRVKCDVVALYFAARDRRVPWYAKAVAAAVAAYALSPMDPIPDFIPVLGYLDELVGSPARDHAGHKAHSTGSHGGTPRRRNRG
jgi:hypothetical protein